MYFRRLRDTREDNDLNQIKIAQILNIDQRVYSNYEIGKRKIPINYLMKLAIFYNTSVDYLVGLTDEYKPYKRTDRNK